MSKENNKIYFSNSPYSNGHKVVDFVWNARLDKDFNLRMDLHLESDQYDEEDEYEDVIEEIDNVDEISTEKSLWINYDHSIISSTFWENKGIEIGSDLEVLNFEKLNNKTFYLDKIPLNKDFDETDLAFGVSMLGNDTIANHEITFIDSEEFGVFDIKWKAKIANTYLGEESFNYDMYVYMKHIKFAGIRLDQSISKERALKYMNEHLSNPDKFDLIELDDLELDKFMIKLKNYL